MNRIAANACYLAADLLIVGYGIALATTTLIFRAQAKTLHAAEALNQAHSRAEHAKDYR